MATVWERSTKRIVRLAVGYQAPEGALAESGCCWAPNESGWVPLEYLSSEY